MVSTIVRQEPGRKQWQKAYISLCNQMVNNMSAQGSFHPPPRSCKSFTPQIKFLTRCCSNRQMAQPIIACRRYLFLPVVLINVVPNRSFALAINMKSSKQRHIRTRWYVNQTPGQATPAPDRKANPMHIYEGSCSSFLIDKSTSTAETASSVCNSIGTQRRYVVESRMIVTQTEASKFMRSKPVDE